MEMLIWEMQLNTSLIDLRDLSKLVLWVDYGKVKPITRIITSI